MKRPFRLRVLRALGERLHGIEYEDEAGRKVEIGTHVYRGRVVFGDNDPLPMISILETPLQNAGSFAGKQGKAVKQPFEIVIQGFVRDDPMNPTDPAHYLCAEVKQRLINARGERGPTGQENILGMNGKVEDITFDAGVVRPPDETSSVAHFWLTVYLELVENLNKPYE